MDRVQCDLGLHTIPPALARVEQARQVAWGIMTVVAMTLQQLRDASDEDLIKAHDDIAHSLNPSVSYYLDELGLPGHRARDTRGSETSQIHPVPHRREWVARCGLDLRCAHGLLGQVTGHTPGRRLV